MGKKLPSHKGTKLSRSSPLSLCDKKQAFARSLSGNRGQFEHELNAVALETLPNELEFDRISSMTSSTKTTKLLATIAYYLCFIILGATSAANGPSLPTLAEHTSSGLDRISLIFIFGPLGYLIGSYFGGRAYDRIPGHKVMSAVLLAIGIASAFIPIANSLPALLLFMFLSGLATGVLDVGGNILLLWTHGEKAGPFVNGLHFFFGVGSFGAPLLLAKILLITGSIHWLYWSLTIACLPIALWLWLLAEPSTHLRSDEGGNAHFAVAPVIFCMLLFLFYVGLELGFGNWIYTYALTLGLGTTITAAYLTSAFWGSFTIGRLLGVWVSTRLRSQTILIMDLVGCAISTIVIMIWKDSNLALWVGTIGLGISMASMFPTILVLAGERMQITGAITGWFLVGSGAGSMFLSWLIGQIFARTGPKTMTTVLLIDIVGIMFVLFLFLARRVIPLSEPAIQE
jgi:FHS family Na+ dependent glucose MFS transporter 1